MPDLHFDVTDAQALPYAAAPTILFTVAIANEPSDEHIHSVMLRTQVRLEVVKRQYDRETQARLLELFGERERWGDTLRSLVWTNTTAVVPQFTGGIRAELPIVCTYDFEVAAAKYFYALEDGEVPLIFLFSGTVFYAGDGGAMQIAQIPWEKEATFRLPVSVWKAMMNHYFPNSAWLRVQKDVFDRLYRFKAERALPTWEAALEELLAAGESAMPRAGARNRSGAEGTLEDVHRHATEARGYTVSGPEDTLAGGAKAEAEHP